MSRAAQLESTSLAGAGVSLGGWRRRAVLGVAGLSALGGLAAVLGC